MTCVIVECRAKHIGKWEQQQHKTSFNQLLMQHKNERLGECDQLSSVHATKQSGDKYQAVIGGIRQL